jgi:sigma-B regulation protein RsbU (phosphoserine phosphatase)
MRENVAARTIELSSTPRLPNRTRDLSSTAALWRKPSSLKGVQVAGLSASPLLLLPRATRRCRPQGSARKRPLPGSSLRQRHETLVKELKLAEQVQRSMLPRSLPILPTLEFGASLRPTLHLAGDFYNVIRLDRDRVGVCIGDVMGHGPAAALLGVFAMQGLRTKSIEGTNYEILPPADVLAGLSRDLIRADFPESPFVTMIYGVLDTSLQTFTYCCGGHPPALLLRVGEPPRRLEGRSPLLGVFEVSFEQDTLHFSPGDRIVLYSDGVESTRWRDFGDGVDGLASLLSSRDGRTPQQLIDSAMDLAEPGDGPNDDLTLVLVEVRS